MKTTTMDILIKNEERVARAREIIGDDTFLMMDCWRALTPRTPSTYPVRRM